MPRRLFHRASATLARRTLWRLGARVALVLVATTMLGYWHVAQSLTATARDTLARYVTERAERESQTFLLAESNLDILKQAFLDALTRTGRDFDPQPEFDRLFTRWPDGAYRRRPGTFNSQIEAGGFVARYVEHGPGLRRDLLSMHRLTGEYGRAWQRQFAATYLASVDGYFATYWPGVDWTHDTPADLQLTTLPWVTILLPENNPQRKTSWTGIWNDTVAGGWFATCVSPVDIDGRFAYYAATSVTLDSILRRTVETRLSGTYNLIFRADGLLIAHPGMADRIRLSNGRYNIEQSNDPHLRAIFHAVTSAAGQTVVENGEWDEYLGIGRIDGPGWYFVTVYPKAMLEAPAYRAARTVLLLGLLSLAFEMLLLYVALKRQVARPLAEIAATARRWAGGDRSARVRMKRNIDAELAELGRAFNRLADSVESSEAKLGEYATRLENEVAARTRELTLAKELAEFASLHDPLTGLPNRVLLYERLQRAILAAERSGGHLAVLFVDLDHFKDINDRFGHESGDQLLKVVAGRLQEVVRRQDTVSRLGGDEFVILLPEVARPEDVAPIADKLQAALAEPIVLHSGEVKVEASIGLCVYPAHGRDAETLVSNADIAMYLAKQGGRNRYQLYPGNR